MAELILITTTSDDRDELELIAAKLIEFGHAACCQISGPIDSVYRWEGKVETSSEWVCSIKTLKDRFAAVADEISNMHHYDTPQIVAVEIVDASDSYREWVLANVE